MAVLAVLLAGPPHVFGMRNGIKVVRVNACLHPAEMVKLKSLGNRSSIQLKGIPMSKMTFSFCS